MSPSWDAEPFRAAVAATLVDFVDAQGERLAPLGEDGARLTGAARRSVSGGKRFRASFCLWGFRAVRPENDAENDADHDTGNAGDGIRDAGESGALVRAASALELLHASALVHDDYMDASDTRRGRPATHREFEAEHRRDGWTGPPERYGAAAAILLGDLLLSWSEELLRHCGLRGGPLLRALDVFDTTRSEVIAGQFLDVSVQARGVGGVAEAMRVLRYKSAKYSVERPLHLGATLAGADPAFLERMSAFGLPLGEAFQLRDDLLGVYGDPARTGKPAGDDLSEGKRTVLVALALERAPSAAARRLDGTLGRPLRLEEVHELQAIIDECGAHAEVEQRIAELTARSLAALDDVGATDQARIVLRELAVAATTRAG